MSATNFRFLKKEYLILFNLTQRAEFNLHKAPAESIALLRDFGEILTQLLFEIHSYKFEEQNTQIKRIRKLEREGALTPTIAKWLKELGYLEDTASEDGVAKEEADRWLLLAFRVGLWLYQSYSVENADQSALIYETPKEVDYAKALEQLEKEYLILEKEFEQRMTSRKLEPLSKENLQQIRERSGRSTNNMDLSEDETRKLLIDPQLEQAGWEVDSEVLNYKTKKTLPERGRNMAIAEWPAQGKWADYALFIGTELYGIVEAKKYAKDISTDLGQSKVYAQLVQEKHEAELLGEWKDCKVPFLFSSNGRTYLEQIKTKSGIWFLDVRKSGNLAKALHGWYAPAHLQYLLQSDIRAAENKLKANPLDFLQSENGLGLRDYQIKAIQAVEEELLDNPERRRVMLAMATGTGKTRTIIGLCYRLIQSNRFRRILFLVDRRMLAKQAIDAFGDNKIKGTNTFASIFEIKGLKDLVPELDTRLQFATVQGMVHRLFYSEGTDIPTVDQFDCIVVDEAHRGYLLDRELVEEDLHFKNQNDYVSQYRRVLDYFDAHAVGLTATPALQTTEIFGSAVFTYSYREAVIDGYLIDHDPPHQMKTKLSEKGIRWEKGEKPKAYDKESNSLTELEELDDELNIDVAGFNKLVITESFNHTIVQELINYIDPHEAEKTLVFAATDEHAERLVDYLKDAFNKRGDEVEDDTIQKITGNVYDAEERFLKFKNEKYPTIAVTVDLLTTGIDVPKICNLVFLRRVKSRILYEQMLGRATRRADDIGKESFQIFDAVRIYEALEDYTQMKPVVVNPKTTFNQLVMEFDEITSEARARKQIEQIIAKLHRKKRYVQAEEEGRFKYRSAGLEPNELIHFLKEKPTKAGLQKIKQISSLWKYLDELKPPPAAMLFSEHKDEYIGTERGYGKGQKPEDYLQSFEQYIRENRNKIMGLQLVCTKPTELDRASLKELLLALDAEGYTKKALQTAWKNAKNEDIAADIIAFIRTLALGQTLISKEERVKRAMSHVRQMKAWNKIQSNWIDRFEKQLMQETVLKLENLDESPFKEKGGVKKLNQVFDEQLEAVIQSMNENLYGDIA